MPFEAKEVMSFDAVVDVAVVDVAVVVEIAAASSFWRTLAADAAGSPKSASP